MPKKTSVKKAAGLAVTVTIDPGLKTLWRDAQARYEKATTEGASAWDVRYEAIADIIEHQPPLYLAGGYATERAFFEKVVGENRTVVYRNVRVAKYASAKELERYGASVLDAAITFVEAKNGGPLKGRTPIDFATLRIPVKSGSKRLADSTVKELRAAIALLRGHARASTKSSPEASAVDGLFKRAGVKGVTFDVRQHTLVLRVPLESIAVVGKALSAYAPPA